MTPGDRGGVSLRLALGVCAVLAAVGCDGPRRSEPIAGPLPPLTGPEARGQVVFMRECNACHPHGEGGLGGALNSKPFPRPLVKAKVRTGLGGNMPTFSENELSDEELSDVVTFMRALRKQ